MPITPFCIVGGHPVTEDQTFRLVGASSTHPPQPMNGFPRGATYTRVGWYPHQGGPSAIIVCSDHDVRGWAVAPTYEVRA